MVSDLKRLVVRAAINPDTVTHYEDSSTWKADSMSTDSGVRPEEGKQSGQHSLAHVHSMPGRWVRLDKGQNHLPHVGVGPGMLLLESP